MLQCSQCGSHLRWDQKRESLVLVETQGSQTADSGVEVELDN